jgi:hypothetical protein
MVKNTVVVRAKRNAVPAATREAVSKMLKKHDLATRELKLAGAVNNAFVTSTPTVTLLTGIAQGDNVTDRDGFQVNLMDLEVNFSVSVGSTSKEDLVRVMIVRDTMNLGSTPTSSDIMNASDPRAFLNIIPSIAKRFVVVHDEMLSLVNTSEHQIRTIRFVKRMNDIPLTFSGTGSTAVHKNAIYLWICGGTSVNDTAYTMYHRFRFFDS